MPDASVVNALSFQGVKGDGVNDDTAGLQAALDSRAGTIHLPPPPKHYLIRHTLILHSGQTLWADRNATIRLGDHAHAHMLTNDDPAGGNRGITVCGGVWDGNNAHQTCEYHQGKSYHVPFEPGRYLGALMQFKGVQDLRIAHVTFKDPETFAIQVGDLERFTIEDITFDYNMLRANMDGVHVHGNCRQGRIANLKGATNDDMVALNADDPGMYELSRGPIEDIVVDGLHAQNGYTAVRLLSAGSPVRRVRLANIFGSYRYYVVSFTHHNAHPGEPSTFEDISIDGVFCSKPTASREHPLAIDEPAKTSCPLIWFAPGSLTHGVHIRDWHRTEEMPKAPPDILVDQGATVEYLGIADAHVVNRTPDALVFIKNLGTIHNLNLANVCARADGGDPRGCIIHNAGEIRRRNLLNVLAENLSAIETP